MWDVYEEKQNVEIINYLEESMCVDENEDKDDAIVKD